MDYQTLFLTIVLLSLTRELEREKTVDIIDLYTKLTNVEDFFVLRNSWHAVSTKQLFK